MKPELRASSPPRIAVFGSSTIAEGDPDFGLAEDLGRILARNGAVVMTGGYGGVMAAASKGAFEAGGRVVGVTVALYADRGSGNAWTHERILAPDLFERLKRLILEADGFVAVTPSLGTLTEVALAWTLLAAGGRPKAPLVLLGPRWSGWLDSMRESGIVSPELLRWIECVDDVDEAVRRLLAGDSKARGGIPMSDSEPVGRP